MAERVGVPVRQIQFWTDAGVLRALPETERKGRGRHRVYLAALPWHGELTWAFIAAELNRLALPVGAMRRVIEMLRRNAELLDTTEPSGWAQSMMFHPVGRALQGYQAIVILPLTEDYLDLKLWLDLKLKEIGHQPEVLAVWTPEKQAELGIQTNEEHRDYEGVVAGLPGEFVAEHRSGYLLNLFKILEPLRAG